MKPGFKSVFIESWICSKQLMIYASFIEHVSIKSEVQIIIFLYKFFVNIKIILNKIMNI